jgi:hypothetical protein
MTLVCYLLFVPLCLLACKLDDKGKQYKGVISTTQSGRTCQKWTSQSPHPHPAISIDNYPDATIEEAWNYCRNPADKLGVGPWCYTTDPAKQWESCGLSFCVLLAENDTPKGTNPITNLFSPLLMWHLKGITKSIVIAIISCSHG